MSYESPVPPIPDRGEELRMIEGYKKSFKEQPSWKLYQNEANRIAKIDYSKKQNQYKKSWYQTFALGGLLSLPVCLYIAYRQKWSFASVPLYYRSAYYQKARLNHKSTFLQWRQIKYGLGTSLFFATVFAYLNCNNDIFDDELAAV